MRGKYCGKRAVRLSVSFLDGASLVLRRRIVEHMNAGSDTPMCGSRWLIATATSGSRASTTWSEAATGRTSGPTSCRFDADQPTLNPEGFTMDTTESEFRRVVRHEAGHSLGFVHEHMRSEFVRTRCTSPVCFAAAADGSLAA